MLACPSCGKVSDEDGRFCAACGTRLPVAAHELEERKTVTVLFCDLVGSTSMGERLDSESTRRVMGHYYTAMRTAIERHGGVVEKFIGDAVMAVFGIPSLSEDDAIRAVRAAADMQAALAEMNRDLRERWETDLSIRVGVNTGEVVTGDPARGEPAVVGDAVNVAARLEQSAAEGEVLIGPETYRLVRDAVIAIPMDPLTLKGKAEPVPAFRLEEPPQYVPRVSRRRDTALVGRDDELEQLHRAYERAIAEQTCELLTIVGDAGIGKTRLISELDLRLRGRAQVLHGRCLPYGEGVTFWPLSEVVRQAAGVGETAAYDEVRRGLESLLVDEPERAAVAERLAALVGSSAAAPSVEEIFWATRRLVATMARQGPLVVVFDDVHWAETSFLDLLEDLGNRPLEGPILVLVVARPELRENRPTLVDESGGGGTVLLRPLGEGDSERLIHQLLGETRPSDALFQRIATTAQGNPLFVEELLRMLNEEGQLESMPPTIQALLAARLGRLSPRQRGVIQAAAVVGLDFWRGALEELLPSDQAGELDIHLEALSERDLIHSAPTVFPGERAFRFGHALIRDAAYSGLLKEARAELHERFTHWLGRAAGERVTDYEEVLGYHLEQSFRYHEQLGPIDVEVRALGEQAARRLGEAGRRAFGRGDMPAAANLLARAGSLMPDCAARRELQLWLGLALCELGEIERAEAVFDETAEAAAAAGDRKVQVQALLERAYWRLATNPDGSTDELRNIAGEAISVLDREGDDAGLARAWGHLGFVHSTACRWTAAAEAYERGLLHARRARDPQSEGELLLWLTGALHYGPIPVREGLRRLAEILDPAGAGNGGATAPTLDLSSRALVEAAGLAGLEAMNGDFQQARSRCARAAGLLEELGQVLKLAVVRQVSGWVELLAGDAEAAERELHASFEKLEEIGEKGYLSTTAALLAEAHYAQGRYAAAERLAEIASGSAARDDVVTQTLWRATRGKVLARRGDQDSAERLVREAVELSRQTDDLNLQADKLVDMSEVLSVGGRVGETERLLSDALGVYEAKGNLVAAGRVRSRLDMTHTKE